LLKVRFLHEIGWKWGIEVYKFIFFEKKIEWPKSCDVASYAVTMRLYTRMKITPQLRCDAIVEAIASAIL
jgi:hypothetical protein